MANLKETGGFSINGKWATRIAYEADLDTGLVSRIDLLDLDDFSLNFDDVVIPKEQLLTDHQLKTAVDRFLESTD